MSCDILNVPSGLGDPFFVKFAEGEEVPIGGIARDPSLSGILRK
jgi:hypothetical protein